MKNINRFYTALLILSLVLTVAAVIMLAAPVQADDSFVKLPDPASLPAGQAMGVAFSPNGAYMAVNYNSLPFVSIYKRSGDTFTKLPDPAELPTYGIGNGIAGIAFSPNSDYMALAHDVSPYVTIYKITSGDNFTKLADPAELPPYEGNGVAFSPDSRYMAVTNNGNLGIGIRSLTIYKITSGDNFTKLADPADQIPATGLSVAFSPDSRYMAVAHLGIPYITVYKITGGDTFTRLANPADLPADYQAFDVAFSPDSAYMAVTHSHRPYLTIYKITSGDNFTRLADAAVGLNNSGIGVAFSPDSQYMAASFNGGFGMIIYKRSGDTFTKVADPAVGPNGYGFGVAFSPDSTNLAVAHPYGRYLTIYKKAPSTTLFYDGFETYENGTLLSAPLDGWLRMYDGEGLGYQYVDNSTAASGAKSLHLYGQPSLQANAYHPVTFPSRFIYQASLYKGAANTIALVQLYTTGDAYITRIMLGDDNWIYAGGTPLTNCAAGTWYNVTADVNLNTRKFNVYVDGTLMRSDLDTGPGTPTSIGLVSTFGSQISWFDDIGVYTISSAPTLTTDNATSINAFGATLKGRVTDDGGEACAWRFIWNKTSGEPGTYTYSCPWETTDNKTSGQTFSQSFDSLDPATTYYYRAVCQNTAGTSYGNEVSFITSAATPTVATNDATSVMATSAVLHGNLIYTNGPSTTVAIFSGTTEGAWTRSDNFTVASTGPFSLGVTCLSPGTSYYYRCYAKNTYGGDWAPTSASFTSQPYLGLWKNYWEGPGKDWFWFSSGGP